MSPFGLVLSRFDRVLRQVCAGRGSHQPSQMTFLIGVEGGGTGSYERNQSTAGWAIKRPDCGGLTKETAFTTKVSGPAAGFVAAIISE